MTSASSFRSKGLILPGPAALCGLSWLSIFLTPSSVMFIGGILGVVFHVPSGLRKPAALVLRALSENGVHGENTDWN